MHMLQDTFKTLRTLPTSKAHFYSLPALEESGLKVRHLPRSLRILLESLLRNCDGQRVKEEDVLRLAKWESKGPQTGEIPFVVSRVLLQDFTGVPLVVDLSAMRDAVVRQGKDPGLIEPLVPVDLVVDHSVQVDRSGSKHAYDYNIKLEFERNRERYAFLKWGESAFETFRVVPPGIGICHQANLEYLASVVTEKKVKSATLLYPDTLVGTDSHTTMVNGLGVVGWGVGGIEAQSAMLGQPVTLETPEVIGVRLSGRLNEGVTATDLTLRVTELLRKHNVVGKFVEFFGKGVAGLTVADRATIANMAPEYGATMGFFPVDDQVLDYLRMTGRDESAINKIKEYLLAQELFGFAGDEDILFTQVLDLDLSAIVPCVSGPKRPQDRIQLPDLKGKFQQLLGASTAAGGYGKSPDEAKKRVAVISNGEFKNNGSHHSGGKEQTTPGEGWSEAEMVTNRPYTPPEINPGYCRVRPCDSFLSHGSVVIAAITSCTNTSNPAVMIAAGLVAKKAVERGLGVSSLTKTSLAPGSRVVTEYLKKSGLQPYLDALGFQLVGYGCTTCIGNSGPLDEAIESTIKDNDLIAASVLSGNRNFEARIHSSVKANFLMSPPLVVAFALAGSVDIDLTSEPIGHDREGRPVFLKEIWPSDKEVQGLVEECVESRMFKERYAHVAEDSPLWTEIETTPSPTYQWDPKSTYIQKPPYFDGFTRETRGQAVLTKMRCLALFGDSVTTDHISPAGAFREDSPAGQYLLSLGVSKKDFNSYGSRRGNHHVMMRGTFANVRLKNQLAGGKEGGFTKLMPEGKLMTIFEAAEIYAKNKTPLIVFAGNDYGMGSSRDWAAKGTMLLGVQAVVACSFERIHRSNLIGMGVLPLQFKEGESYEKLGIVGNEIFSLVGVDGVLTPRQMVTCQVQGGQATREIELILRLDTAMEIDYYRNGGIMPYVLRQLL